MTQRAFDVNAIRSDFPIFSRLLPKGVPLTYLDSGASSQKPQCVIDKERDVNEQYYANAYRGVHQFGARISEELDEVRDKVRAFIAAESADEIVFTSGTTMSINLVAQGWGRKYLSPGDVIVINEMEHHANFVPWQFIAEQTGAQIEFIPLTDDGRLDIEKAADVITKRTKLVAVCGMSNVTGVINPIETICSLARDVGALVLVDAAQSVPHALVNVVADGIDFLAFSGHKLFGPSGIGVLYGRRELLDAMDPVFCGGHMINTVSKSQSTWADPPAKFEAGTPAITQTIGLGTAIDYVNSIGLTAIHDHEQQLLRYAHEQLEKIPGMRIHGPGPVQKGPIVSFTIDQVAAEDLAQLLSRKGVFVRHGHHCTMPLHDWLGIPATTRASFAMYNTTVDVDALVSGIHFARERLRLT
ncbi:MAG: SufS family cysteine desulfurase [Planctomycetota bacterium]|nr:SufS family cysteine desulfurase [Planctomycetota bacterium]